MSSTEPVGVLEFWFGSARQGAAVPDDAFKRWFSADAGFDREVERRFGEDVREALDGGLKVWESDARSRLALILLLDQFTRNIFRGKAEAFSGDRRALQLARDTVSNAGDMEALSTVEKVFLLMPFQHVEDAALQDEGVRRYRQLEADAPEPLVDFVASTRRYAELHRDIVQRFGRFPHRNGILGRASSPEEQAWLDDDAPRFGQ